MKMNEKIRRFLVESSVEMLEQETYQNGTVFFQDLGNGLSVVLDWEEGYEYDEANMFSKRFGSSDKFVEAENLVASVRYSEPLNGWYNNPSDWECVQDGYYSLDTADCKDRMSSAANYLTEIIESTESELSERFDLETIIWE